MSVSSFTGISVVTRSAAFAALVAGAACGNDSTSVQASDGSLAAAARQVLEEHHAAGEFTGAVLALHDDERGDAFVTVGTDRPEPEGKPVDPDVPWVIGSSTKTFVAVVVLQLAEAGSVDLDASVEPYFPDLPRASEITTRELLQHTSGIAEYLESPAVTSDAQRFWSPQELVAVAVAQGPVGEPGGEHHYANTNYILLGELIEKVTGRPWYTEVHDRILAPLGMQHTAYAGEADALPLGPGFAVNDGQFVETTHAVDPSVGGAAGAIESTAADLMRFARALRAGSLLDAERNAEMRSFVPAEPRGYVQHYYGLGFEKYVLNELTLCGHAGSAPTQGSFVGFDPDTGLTVAVVTNSSEPAPPPLMAAETIGAITQREVGPPSDASGPAAQQ